MDIGNDVDSRARIGDGTQIWHLAQVREGAVLGENCVVSRFCDAVLGYGNDVLPFAAGARTVAVAQAVLESSRTGQSAACGPRTSDET